LKESPEFCDTPIIVLSASAEQEMPKALRFDDYLMKPVSTEQLLSKISKYIDNKAAKNTYTSSETRGKNMTLDAIEPGILIDLKNRVTPLIEQLETSMIISNVKNLASMLILFGQQHDLKWMTNEGEELMRNAESYDIVKIKSKLEKVKEANLGGWTA
ncbi:MAG: response regulator receiver protein, partial [Clostridiales bacterium]|nr:response regulator receiver protein [Clostridiales bacterium]